MASSKPWVEQGIMYHALNVEIQAHTFSDDFIVQKLYKTTSKDRGIQLCIASSLTIVLNGDSCSSSVLGIKFGNIKPNVAKASPYAFVEQISYAPFE